MANTFTQIYLQLIFAIQNRISLIQPSWKDELYKYITGIIQTNKHKLLIINGTSNHIHILIDYKPHQLIPELLQHIKGHSSKWINQRGFVKGKFQWQQGYGAFSYSKSQISRVIEYIENQQEHHKVKTFREEYLEILDKFQISYDKEYVLKDIT
jgi:REP element-mobilizing transposase RayT